MKTNRVSNSLDTYQSRCFVRQYLGQNCWQRLLAHDKSPLIGSGKGVNSIAVNFLLQDEVHLLHDDRGPVLESLVAR